MTYSKQHLSEAIEIINKLDTNKIEEIVRTIKEIRDNNGRIFFLGVGGSAGNCSHAVNDFRKILDIECYAPSDNVSELTARTNDDGWDSVFSEWLKVSRLSSKDGLFIFSVGGGNLEKNISPNLVKAIQLGLTVKAKILGIVGKDGGFTAKSTQQCLVIPTVNENNITPHSEAFQAVIWHLIVSHPELKVHQTKWESVK